MSGEKSISLASSCHSQVTTTEKSVDANTNVARTRSEQTTSFTTTAVTIQLRVDKFMSLTAICKRDTYFCSEGVTSDEYPNAIWTLQIYPRGSEEHNLLAGTKEIVSIYVQLSGLASRAVANQGASCQISFLDTNQQSLYTLSSPLHLDTPASDGQIRCGKYFEHSAIKSYVSSTALVVKVEVDFLLPTRRVVKSPLSVEEGVLNCVNSLGVLFADATLSDCFLKVGNVKFGAHRAILSARSPTFASMFSNPDYKEAKEGVITITDIEDPQAVRVMLRFIYTGLVGDKKLSGESRASLLQLADKYTLLDLKAHLEDTLASGIDAGNFAQVAALADSNACSTLKEACASFFSEHSSAVRATEAWAELKKERPLLAAELLDAIYKDN